ncbi:MAG: hypothetical protein QNJ16_08945 [Rhodobacter sp.]|nr:hypothetical protein [Rhodobacter sp.]
MGLFDRTPSVDGLLDLLERERVAVLDGRFDQLERLTAEKERLLQAIPGPNTDMTELAQLKKLGERNAALLSAMQSGVRSAIRRIEAFRSGPASLQTYTASGQRQCIGDGQASLQHRA